MDKEKDKKLWEEKRRLSTTEREREGGANEEGIIGRARKIRRKKRGDGKRKMELRMAKGR